MLAPLTEPHAFEYTPFVFESVASRGGCTVGPGLCACAEGAEVAGIRVVAVWGDRVGYLRAAEPAALPALDAEFPML